ncbi:MAG TPA: S1C family serine protease [Pirellulales bacterium]|nr:S1C family serine protease [Pirellulales bacterium]
MKRRSSLAVSRVNRIFRLPISSAMLAAMAIAVLAPATPPIAAAAENTSFARTVASVEPKIVKIFGSGGMPGLADYQSGFLISSDGFVLTAWSHVLDTDDVTVILDDGRKFTSKLVGADPRLELAVLKIEAGDLPFFDLSKPMPAAEGTRVLAFSNLFGVATGEEPASVLHGTIAAVTTLDARRGAYETPYQGPIYALDAMTNNPGAAGGALTDLQGNLLGVLGKELRNARNNVWLNFAIPTAELASSIEAIRNGKNPANTKEAKPKKPDNPLTLDRLGLVLIPNVLDRTPPFVDDVRAGSPAASAGIHPDDLILLVDSQVVQSCAAVQKELSQLEADAEVRLTLMRGNDLLEVQVKSGQPQGQ